MKLIIDIGNTRIKSALFVQEQLQQFFIFDSYTDFFSAKLFQKYKIQHCIVATVVDEIEEFVEQLKQYVPVLLFNSETTTPLKNNYKSIQTLGSDRLAAAVGGNHLFRNHNLLVIDAGTCIKYNFINSNNEYLGGAISPGIQMRLKALHTFTDRLPLIEFDENFNNLIGTNSKESILSGVEMGALAEVEGLINKYQQQYPDIKIILTGGDANFFEKRLKNPIFADSFIILKGLNIILDHQLNEK